jgi:hypothetical protein
MSIYRCEMNKLQYIKKYEFSVIFEVLLKEIAAVVYQVYGKLFQLTAQIFPCRRFCQLSRNLYKHRIGYQLMYDSSSQNNHPI